MVLEEENLPFSLVFMGVCVCVCAFVSVRAWIVRGPPGVVAGWGSPLCVEHQSVQVKLLQWGGEGRKNIEIGLVYFCAFLEVVVVVVDVREAQLITYLNWLREVDKTDKQKYSELLKET